uniref:Glycosyl transferase family 4 n=1 Tax=Candidatus Methanomethylicus mesodigestus TaxID=1867258 RepID=A0A7C3ITC4_9CREN
MDLLLIPSPLISALVSFILIRKWIPVAFKAGLTGKDMNKPDKPAVAEMGGVAVMGGILAGLLYYITLNTFYLNQKLYNLDLFAAFSTILIISFIGFIDDILGWKIGIKQWQKPLLTLPAALPMMVINAGHTTISLPFGDLSLGILYPLLFVPLGIVGASNGFNMLAGYNGLEAGMGIIIVGALTYATYVTGSSWVSMIGLVTLGSLLVFIWFNWCPAKLFPGNGFTYLIGSIIGIMAILGNAEKFALLLFVPYIIDFILPLRSGLKAEAFAKVNSDGSLEMPYEKVYDLTHLMILLIKKIKLKVYERDVTISIILIELIVMVIGLLAFFK